jgi:hypothetical protein
MLTQIPNIFTFLSLLSNGATTQAHPGVSSKWSFSSSSFTLALWPPYITQATKTFFNFSKSLHRKHLHIFLPSLLNEPTILDWPNTNQYVHRKCILLSFNLFHQHPHLILLTEWLYKSPPFTLLKPFHMLSSFFQWFHRICFTKNHKTNTFMFNGLCICLSSFLTKSSHLQNALPNRMITTKTSIQIKREQNT